MNTIEKLAPCPFCGSTGAQFERIGTPRQSCIVACNNCGARHESSDEGPACGSSWNDRAQQAGGVPAGWRERMAERVREAHDASLDDDHKLARVLLLGIANDLAAAPSPSAVQPLTAEQALRDALEAMGSKKAQELSAGDLMAVVCYVDASTSPSAVQPLSEAQIEVLRFLDGLGDLHGFGFGDKPPTERGNYWWRKDLRTAFPDVDFGIVTNESST